MTKYTKKIIHSSIEASMVRVRVVRNTGSGNISTLSRYVQVCSEIENEHLKRLDYKQQVSISRSSVL